MKNYLFWIFLKKRHKKNFFEAGSQFRKSILSENKQKIQSTPQNHLAVVWTDGVYITAPAHQHATWVAVYSALFFLLAQNPESLKHIQYFSRKQTRKDNV